MATFSVRNAEHQGVLSTQATAEYLATTVGTLAKWRYLGEGPPYVKFRRKVVYRPEDLDEYIRSRQISTAGGR